MLTDAQSFQGDGAYAQTFKIGHRKTHEFTHAAKLMLAAFADYDAEYMRTDDSHFGGKSHAILQFYSGFK